MNREELAAALQRNERWLRDQIKKGYKFLDIGIDPTRSVRSPFYPEELTILRELGVEVISIARNL